MSSFGKPRIRPFGEVAAEIGHELNNQIGIVSGRAELARVFLDRSRTDDVRAGLDVILRQMDRMRVLAERLRGMRQEPRALRPVDLHAVVLAALAEHPVPGLGIDPSALAAPPPVSGDDDTIRVLFATIRGQLLGNPAARVGLALQCEPGAKSAALQLDFEGLPLDRARSLLVESVRVLAPTGLTTRVDFTERTAHLQIEFPLEALAAHS